MNSSRNTLFSNKQLLAIFFVKLVMLLFAIYFFGEQTKLGDTPDYVSGKYLFREDWKSPAYIMSWLGFSLKELFGSYLLVNFFGLLLSFFGVFYLSKHVKVPRGCEIPVFLMLISPSFSMWSSLVSKESVVVFCSAVFIVGLVQIDNRERGFLSPLQILSLGVLLLFKFYYSPVYIALLLLSVVNGRRGGGASIKMMVFFGVFVFCFCAALVSPYLVEEMPKHFAVEGSSTRINDFWVHDLSFLTYMPIGVVVAFFGPTLEEVFYNPIFFPFFLESLIILFFMCYITFQVFMYRYVKVYVLAAFLVAFLGFLVIHYPFGVFNPGSAIRYRTNFVLFFSVYFSHLAFYNRQSLMSVRHVKR